MEQVDDPQVIIVGAGPGGLCLAGELALAGVRCTVLERRSAGSRDSRALGLQSRTLELLALRDLVAPFIERGNPIDHFRIAVGGTRIGLTGLDSDYRQVNICPQHFIERVLEERALANGATIVREVRVLEVRTAADHAVVRLRDGDGIRELRASWVVGCDGPNSVTRESVGIGFPGHKYPYHVTFADVRLTRQPPHGAYMKVSRHGLGIGFDFGDGRWRIGALERLPLQPPGEVPLEEISTALRRVFGYDLGPHNPLWTSRAIFRLGHASTYRRGRVFVLGDAAHVQSPLGGQGLNLTLQDSMNLGWKLGAVVRGADERLLDTYEQERRAVATTVLRVTDRGMRLLMSGRPPQRILRRLLLPTLTSIPPVHDRMAGALSGIGFAYPVPDALGRATVGPLGGSRLPNATVELRDGTTAQLYEQFHRGQFVLVDQGNGELAEACAPWGGAVTVLSGRTLGRPALASLAGYLARPDGYCAWGGTSGVPGLRAAMQFWCGSPSNALDGTNNSSHDVVIKR